ncbi:MAG TPA: hypothetical protein VFY14_20475, partial [Streptomyces sp.]|nr:hypothetical protein [Streptomyces sp.]
MSRRDDSFVITVSIRDRITVSSPPPHWKEVAPSSGLTGGEAVRHLLERVEQAAARVRADFTADALPRNDPELAGFAELSHAARSPVARWTEGSRRIRGVGDADADGEPRAYGEPGNTYAAGAWEIATALADCAPGHAPTR